METRDDTASKTQGATHMDLHDKRVPEVVEKLAPLSRRGPDPEIVTLERYGMPIPEA